MRKKIGKVYVTGVSLAYADIGSAVGFVVVVLLYELSSKLSFNYTHEGFL